MTRGEEPNEKRSAKNNAASTIKKDALDNVRKQEITSETADESNHQELWLNADGSEKTTAQIKRECRTWRACTWEAYLSALEKRRRESLFKHPATIKKMTDEHYNTFYRDLIATGSYPENRKALKLALSKLPRASRQVLRYRLLDELPYKEISKITGRKESTLRSSANFGIKKLKEIIVAQFFEKQDPSDLVKQALRSFEELA